MFSSFEKLSRPYLFSRIFADFLMVHTSLVAALVASWIRGTHAASESVLFAEAHAAVDQYVHLFLPLSLIFPAAFLLSGITATTQVGHSDGGPQPSCADWPRG